MLRISTRVFLAVLLAAAAGCQWRGYERVVQIHLEVLEGTTFKMIDKATSTRHLDPNDLTEMTYPLEKARQFARRYAGEQEPASLRRFNKLLDRYEKLIQEIDAARGDPTRWQTCLGTLPEQRRQIATAVEGIRTALAAE